MTTKTTIALADLVEKGADTDLLHDMIQYVAQRLMELDTACAPRPTESGARNAPTAATATANGSGKREPVQSI